jgi:plasmid maintenance system antidote protein VapI
LLFADFSGIINYLNSEITVVSKGELMLKNNIEVDVKVKCIELGITQAQLAENIKTTSSYVNRVIKKKDGVINNTFIKMMEELGYDIELNYVKRTEE